MRGPWLQVARWQEASSYWEQSRTPLASLVAVMPLVLFYELGMLLLGPAEVRNGAEVWLRQLLSLIGLGEYFLLPLITVGILAGWHLAVRPPTRLTAGLLAGMMLESLGLALLLAGLAHVQGWLMSVGAAGVPGAWLGDGPRGLFARLVCFAGAGLYEELLFRLVLLPGCFAVLAACKLRPEAAAWGAVLLTSLVFAAAHYVGPLGDAWELSSFVFRTLAGILFAVVFVARGFGIAACTHAAYDVLVGIVGI
ncbi:MAG: CPBP family intramembrane metalloprotease [Pirellulales bacterium]|nr:CPBP family intramembrane metalloprotease [Pirellulales bacterium]